MADVLMAEPPINNINKVNPQLQIKDESNNVPAFPDLLPLAQRPINLKTEKRHQRQRSFLKKECDS